MRSSPMLPTKEHFVGQWMLSIRIVIDHWHRLGITELADDHRGNVSPTGFLVLEFSEYPIARVPFLNFLRAAVYLQDPIA